LIPLHLFSFFPINPDTPRNREVAEGSSEEEGGSYYVVLAWEIEH
jgi:hypothetical protein